MEVTMTRHLALAIGIFALSLICKDSLAQKSAQVTKSGGAETHVLFDGKAQVEMLLDCGQGHCPYLGIFEGKPGLKVPEHVHQDSEEMLYCLSGHGILTVGGQVIEMKAGDAVRIPIGVPHSFEVPEGAPDFRAIQVFPQGGPQDRFRKAPLLEKHRGKEK
jgi:quercetin dioxygenase-like cupin family protein